MGKEKMSMRKIVIIIISFIILNLSINIEGKENEEVSFNYKKIIDDEFTLQVGDVIPVTIEQSIETDGTFTNDGRYFFFTSDKGRGNFDIYLRSLTDITYARITEHASKDTSPAVSPNGKYLAFVSQREDPEGDIFLLKLDPEEIIAKAKVLSEVSGLDAKAKNLTLFQDPLTKTIKIIKDASPCWSPDGDHIAFSSTRGGPENIWLMDKNGKDLTQVTKKGGIYPRFSNDGKKIIFISYSDRSSDGEIYTVDIENLRETRITNAPGIKLFPGFTGKDHEIIYTMIDRDTNGDKKVDLKDNSVIYYKNLNNGLEYQLTLYSESSFSPVWSPVYNGIIIYSNQTGENINVNIIPQDGIIPKKQNARLQLDLAEKYIKEYDDVERYLLCLERVYQFFGTKEDADSKIYVSRALKEAFKMYIGLQDKNNAIRIRSFLDKLSRDELDYSTITSRYLNNLLNGKPGDPVIRDAISRLRENEKDEKNKSLLPFLLEYLGDEYTRSKNSGEAVKTYANIINEFPDYKRLMYIHYKSAGLAYKSLQIDMSPSYLQVLSSNYLYLQIDATKDILKIFGEEKNPNKKIATANRMLEKYKEVQSVPELLLYIIGKTYLDKGDLANAKSSLLKGLEISKKLTYMYYKINILLGRVSEMEKNYPDMEKYLSAGANKYERRYKEAGHRDVLQKLIGYYEEYGERAESTGDYKKAVELYDGYVNLLRYLHTRKFFNDVYNEYASRAHILYIDAYSEWKGNDQNELAKLENEYNQKENRLARARISLDKAHIYGLAYIYTKMASMNAGKTLSANNDIFENDLNNILSGFNMAVDQVEWALFMDDRFIDPELLKGWIYQYVDLMRQQDKESGARNAGLFDKYFPEFLWEKDISDYEKAIEINDERVYPGREGNLQLNLANTYFLLSNYPRAFSHYKEAQKYKKNFGSKIEEALFYYHLGYCCWQNDELSDAKEEMSKTLLIYESLSSGDYKRYRYQIYYLYRFFALFDRIAKNYDKAISWYNRIIELSNKYHIKIDRARYMQEIAFCYKELGETKIALVYLNKADELLKEYEISEKDNNIKIKILGLGKFNIWNLGADTLTIGDNRIYTELDTIQEKLLNASIEEEIYYDSGDLQNAIASLNKKLAILSKNKEKIYNETRIKALNNIGIYYFKSGNYVQAQEYFKQAQDLASDPDVNDLEGIFVSVVNIANLCSFILENGIGNIKEPIKSLDSLIRQIAQYRESYEKNRYDEEMKKLKDAAKAQAREVKAEEIDAVREKILKEAGGKYYTLDVAIAELEYQKAELLRKEGLSADIIRKKDAGEKAYGIYTFNKNIYSLYSDAINRFANAVGKAELNQSKRLLIKLLLNLGACQERIGLINESYNIYISALKYASAYGYDDLAWIVHQRTADFLVKYGKEIEEDNYLTYARESYKSAADIIERFPYMYSGEMQRIKALYNKYTRLLITLKNPDKALEISERGYAVIRIILTGLTSPQFYSKEDNDSYYKYVRHIKEIEKGKHEISTFIETGGADTNELVILKKELDNRISSFKDYTDNITKTRPLFASFISLPVESVPEYENAVIYEFIDSFDGIYAWKIDSGKVFFKELIPENENKDLFPGSVNNFMQDGYTDKYRFVVMNAAAVNILQGTQNKNEFPPFMYVPSVERARYYMSAANISLDAKSVIIDEKSELTPAVFFRKRMEPSLLMIKTGYYQDYIAQITEAGLYAGVKTLYLYNEKTDLQDKSNLIHEIRSASFDEFAYKNKNILGIGFKGYKPDEREKIKNNFKETEYSSYIKSLEIMDIGSAELHLNKWYEIKSSTNDNATYLLGTAELEFLKGNLTDSIFYTGKAIQESLNISPDIYLKAISGKIFLLLYTGNFPAAESMMQQSPSYKNFNMTADYLIYKSILNLVREEKMPPIDEYRKFINENSILPKNKLKLLFAEYLNLFGNPGLMNTVLEDWKRDYIAGERDILKVYLLKGKSEKNNFLMQRAKETLSMSSYNGDMESLKNKALIRITSEGRYDGISVYPVFFAVNNFIKNMRSDIAISLLSQADIGEINKNALWLDAVPLTALMIKVYEAEEKNDAALSSVKELNNLLKTFGLSSLLKVFQYKEAVLLSKTESYNDSYNLALTGIALVNKSEDLYIKYQLLLIEEALYLGKIEEAINRIAELESEPNAVNKQEYKYVIYLLKSRLELLDIIKKKKASDADLKKVENLILSALGILDSSPDIIVKHNRIDLVNEALDSLILFKMSRNDAEGSLLYAETKKLITVRAKYYNLFSSYFLELPEDVLKKYKAVKDKRESGEFAGLIKKYPGLLFNALPGIMPIDVFQKQLPDDSIALYLVANGKDILCWVISRESIKTLRIKDGYEKADEIVKDYYNNLSIMGNTSHISRGLYNLFKNLEKYYKEKKNIIIITDNALESIPFEILGERDMLEESFNLKYLSSILTSFGTYEPHESIVHFINQNNKKIIYALEIVSVKESGIPFDYSANVKSGIAHINSEILFDTFNNQIYINGKLYRDIITRAGTVYSPEYNFTNISLNEFTMINTLFGIKEVIVNNAGIHDFNNAFFIDTFYNKLSKREGLITSFQYAKESLRKSKQFSYPAYWAGIRLYLNGLEQ